MYNYYLAPMYNESERNRDIESERDGNMCCCVDVEENEIHSKSSNKHLMGYIGHIINQQ